MRTFRTSALAGITLAILCALLPLGAALLGQNTRATVPPSAGTDAPVDIVVQGAVDAELQPLLAALEEKEEIQIAAWTFWRGRMAGSRST